MKNPELTDPTSKMMSLKGVSPSKDEKPCISFSKTQKATEKTERSPSNQDGPQNGDQFCEVDKKSQNL